jgi:hypothetical protein
LIAPGGRAAEDPLRSADATSQLGNVPPHTMENLGALEISILVIELKD